VDSNTAYSARDRVQLLDVREDDEWAAGRIDGAVHIPLGELPVRVGELDRDRPVVTVCRSGGRAGRAAGLLTQAGVSAEVMDGGMTAWFQAGLPMTSDTGNPHVA
jgi:rhodanese-related sulfurtransferase